MSQATPTLAIDGRSTVPASPTLDGHDAQLPPSDRGAEEHKFHGDEEDASSKKDGSIDTEKIRHQQIGVTRIETLWRHFGNNKTVLSMLGVALFLVCCVFSLDSSTTYTYEAFGASYYKDHARLLGVVSTVETIINAVSKPFIAKLADITSRQTSYLFLLVLYLVGYIIIAASHNGYAFAAGRVISTIGSAGLDLVTDIIVADLTPLEWRGFFGALTSLPFIWFAWISGNISQPILSNSVSGFRWGFGMFCIIAPVCVLPVVILLYWADHRAKQNGELRIAESPFERRWREEHPGEAKPNLWHHLAYWSGEVDAIGLLLLGFAWTMLLLPFSLAPKAKGKWHNPSMIAMLVIGAVLLIVFFVWEWKFARSPMMTRSLIMNRTFLLCAAMDFIAFFASNLRSLYWSSYVYVITDWSIGNWNRYTNAETVALTVFALICGIVIRVTHRYKGYQILGLSVRIIGMGLVVLAGSKDTVNNAVFALIPVLIGFGSWSTVGIRVASQGSVPHQDLGQVIANLALWTRIGGAIGSAIASTTWQTHMQANMRKFGVPTQDITKLYSSIKDAKDQYPYNSPERLAVVRAYNTTTRPLYIAGLALYGVAMACALCMPNFYIGKTHNVIEKTDVAGRVVIDDKPVTHAEREAYLREQEQVTGKKSIWQKFKTFFV
ncbi:uncharacterized protein I303_108102 [Kwoniella dejecticola CBS 10117]|uniref:Major facilitator superfamily (MFS) profile domain-containing protein n=1 Tax=Kwoniella dejecticola CBS 10117 TaxID=1296121 RepID=A0A1A5ZWJ9_9TREE|nr:uncharacterized protein I303_08093 [Kwoniella dejecticola CBS 10117]OBR82179.1 hypothetical protein I303_08093 [Kwoniella dejecticola CBS 10117]